jgi:hypothetical protein
LRRAPTSCQTGSVANWHWLQFRVYESKTPGRDRWAVAHLYPLGPAGELGEVSQLCAAYRPGFKPWTRERLVRHAPDRARKCQDCLQLAQHAKESHGGDLDDLARSLGTG